MRMSQYLGETLLLDKWRSPRYGYFDSSIAGAKILSSIYSSWLVHLSPALIHVASFISMWNDKLKGHDI
jgi:hypothetical protein